MHDEKPAGALNFALLLLLGLLWGMPYALTHVSLATIPPLTMVAARTALAAVALWLFAFMSGCRMPARLDFVPMLFVQGLFACLIPHTLIAFGQQSVDSALAAILNSTTPIYVCILTLGTKHRDALSLSRWLGLALGLAGVVIIVGAGALAGLGKSAAGQAAIVLATLSSAVGVIYGRRLNGIAPEIAAAGTLTAAAVVLVPLCFCVEAPLAAAPSWPSVTALIANALGATALGFVIYFRLIRSIGSIGTASVGYLKPAFGVLIGCTLLAEPFTWTIAIGLMATLIGVAAIVQTNVRRPFADSIPRSKASDLLQGHARARPL